MIYEVYNEDPPELQDLKQQSGTFLFKGLSYRHLGKWDQAIELFKEALRVYPNDLAAKHHIKICETLKQQNLGAGWDGAWVLDEK